MAREPLLEVGNMLGESIKIIEFLGSGGQGEVYKVLYLNQQLALKWYYPHIGTDKLKDSLKYLISKGAPDDNFLWPIALVEDNHHFGYLMELRPNRYKSLKDWVTLKFDMNISSIAKACYQLTDAFHKLHAKGLSYKDISFGNLFIEPISGKILICDNDNITANGMTINNLLGTPKFMAPEIVMGGTTPNTETDQFSLAILLFYILCISHPFEGQLEANISCFDEVASKRLYGYDAVYIYDEVNDSNRPVPGIHNNAINLFRLYPTYIKDLFYKTFTIGVKEPNKRTRESEWRQAFYKMQHGIITCPNCDMENIYDVEVLKEKGAINPCVLCHQELRVPPRIRFNNQIFVLNSGKKIYANDININQNTVIATVDTNDSNYFITNQSNEVWQYKIKTKTFEIYPNQSFKLHNNSTLYIGTTKGDVRV